MSAVEGALEAPAAGLPAAEALGEEMGRLMEGDEQESADEGTVGTAAGARPRWPASPPVPQRGRVGGLWGPPERGARGGLRVSRPYPRSGGDGQQ